MIIRKLTIENFLVFKDRQTLELSDGLYVIHGENGFGKSTFLNAISWGLLGRFNDRQGQRVPDSVLMNQHAKKEGANQVQVEMVMDNDGEESLVRRTYNKNAGKTDLYVKRGSTTLHHEDAERFLRGVLDKNVARFFLFDGEDLRRYEEMLTEGGEPQVRQAVEHILGLPALLNAVTDLRAVEADFRKKATAASTKEGHAAQAVLYAQQMEKNREAAEENLAGVRKQQADQEALLAQAEEVLGRDKHLNAVLAQRDAKKVQIEGLKQDQNGSATRRREALAGAWVDVLAGAVDPVRAKLEEDLGASDRRKQDERVIARLEQALSAGECDECGQPLAGGAVDHIKEQIEHVRAGMPDTSGDIETLRRIALALAGVKVSGRLAEAIEEDKRVAQLDRDIVDQTQLLEDLAVEASPDAQSEIRKATEQHDGALKALGVIESQIKEAEAAVAAASDELKQAQKDVQAKSASPESAKFTAQADAADELADLFETAIGIFRDERREQVGEDASEVFSQLTTSDEATGLRIDKNYGLVTLDSAGEPVPGRSAGQEQIVAFSLIGALNRNATRTAPVVMDTPLGRLDKGHRANVLRYLSDMADQVFLLVHSAEVDDEDLNEVRDQVEAEYELRKQDEFHTVIEKRAL